MRFQSCIRFSLAGLFVLLAVVEVAWTRATSPAPASENSAGYGLFALAFAIGLMAITRIAVRLYDMKREDGRRRSREATIGWKTVSSWTR